MDTATHISNPSFEKKPNYTLRRAAALGGIALALVFGKDFIDRRQEVSLLKDIENAGELAVENYKAGKFDEGEVTLLESNKPQTASNLAVSIANEGHDVRELQSAIVAQTGPHVEHGEQFVAPLDYLENPAQPE